MFSHKLFRFQSRGGDSSSTTRKLTYDWMLNNGLMDQFSPNESKQNEPLNMGSHICCENLSRNLKLSVVGRESHRRAHIKPPLRRVSDSCMSKAILDTYPHQPDTNNPTTKRAAKSTNTVCHSRRDWQGDGALSYHPNSVWNWGEHLWSAERCV